MLARGEVEREAVEKAYRMGLPVPEKYRNSPHLQMGLEFVYDAFIELGTQRSVGMGVGPIPWSAVMDYGRFYGLVSRDLHEFKDLVFAMDRVYLKRVSNPNPKGKPKK